MLQFNSVSRVFDDGTRAVNNVSLRVEKGEFCVLLGPSGAGKTTLMNMVNGVVIPDSGDLSIGGVNLSRKTRSAIQRKVGMIHQQLNLIPRLSVLHNVLTGILPQAGFLSSLIKIFPQEQQRKACQLLHEVGLEERHLYRRASNLSGGQQQRVAIARAFMSSPEVVLADEPVASLDPAMSRSVLQSLKSAAQHHDVAVLCTLHQMDYALEFADRIIALRAGEVFFDGRPDQMDKATQEELYKLAKPTQPNADNAEQVAA
ncbi:phosphonate ABC transporter ATP-binding protein [uncultured Neptuniibacter sp.]|uniref:phosphonate ABC transporter ATP-binding protein n=1 Tax=uncultured Neptuniibacter sp. TaxID=502143 RepID=UPI002618F760|nr:phosphonate ABC transporter ATP-binding protein [uncultured Neptuniibacter sp.]